MLRGNKKSVENFMDPERQVKGKTGFPMISRVYSSASSVVACVREVLGFGHGRASSFHLFHSTSESKSHFLIFIYVYLRFF